MGKEADRAYHSWLHRVVAYSWWHLREHLGFTRQKSWGRT
jgi:hypothetical protein